MSLYTVSDAALLPVLLTCLSGEKNVPRKISQPSRTIEVAELTVYKAKALKTIVPKSTTLGSTGTSGRQREIYKYIRIITILRPRVYVPWSSTSGHECKQTILDFFIFIFIFIFLHFDGFFRFISCDRVANYTRTRSSTRANTVL